LKETQEMPRKKQTVQKQRRRKVYRAGELSGEAVTLKKRGAFRVFSNYRLFAIIGAVAIGGGLIFSAVNTGGSTTGSREDSRRSQIERAESESTAQASGTPTDASVTSFTAPELVIDPTKTYRATIKTAKGEVELELLPQEAPGAVNSFVFLAEQGFYDGVTFHRVIEDFVAQAGDPTGSGGGGPGYTLPRETNDLPVEAGVIGMVRKEAAGSATNGSQFAIVLSDTYADSLAKDITVFGKVASASDLEVMRCLTKRDPGLGTADLPPGDVIESIEITSS
jgi:cyclophilin family peptidyl-prolyl cis-trans isomerase